MKFNLKNRPRLRTTILGYSYSDVCKFEEWFEGFEKELRQKLESNLNFLRSFNIPPQDPSYAKLWAEISLIKEILGEKNEG